MLNIAIIGTRGIPNFYGGFEQFAEYLAKGLVEKNYKVTVYNSSSHPYKESSWNGVTIVHCNDPEDKWGTVGQFIYDLNCIRHARKQSFDIILQLGYTSSSVWGPILPRKAIITTNMDGLEWKRSKYSKAVQLFLKKAEYLAVKFSDFLISDSIGIQDYLVKKYKKTSTYIPYGANLFYDADETILKKYSLNRYQYNMLIARFEPENNLETILDGVAQAGNNQPFLVIGNYETKFGEYLVNKFRDIKNIKFLGPIYDIGVLNNLRYYSNIYFHGHSVGGTNPSLLEAMASNALICAHDNPFNKAILQQDAFYFTTKSEVQSYIEKTEKKNFSNHLNNNIDKIKSLYSWEKIIEDYENHFIEISKHGKNK